MRWLFVVGISLDLAGAVLIAWTIYSRTPEETREEATSRLDASLWTVVFREREQAHVKAGMALLGSGFGLQLAGYIAGFRSGSGRVVAPVVAVAVFLTSLSLLRNVATKLSPLRYVDASGLPDGIQDERHSYCVATLDQVERYRELWLDRIRGKQIVHSKIRVQPRINAGRWLFDCPACAHNGVSSSSLATPGLPTGVCLTCGSAFLADFPPDRNAVEQLLSVRPVVNQNWSPSETVIDLRKENEAHGLASDQAD